MLKLIIASVVLVGISVLLFAIGMLFKKNGKFPNTHISSNKALSDRGITCATSQHREAQKNRPSYRRKGVDGSCQGNDNNVC